MPSFGLPHENRKQLGPTMRNKVLWRLTPTLAEEVYIREQARREGRPLAGMLHKLLGEAIFARQQAEHQVETVRQLVSAMKTPTNSDAAT